MRKYLVGMAVVLWLSMGHHVQADDTAKKGKSGNWFTRLFAGEPKDPKKEDTKKETPTPNSENKTPTVVESAAAQRARELAAWRRRVEVCDKLREIALTNQDDDLLRKADQLDQRVWDTYVQRTGQLPSNQGGMAMEEQQMQRLLGMDGGNRQRDELLRRQGRAGEDRAAAGRKNHE